MNPSVVSKKTKSLQEALVHLEQTIALLTAPTPQDR